MVQRTVRRLTSRVGALLARLAFVLLVGVSAAGCNTLVTEGRASSFPVIEQLLANAGGVGQGTVNNLASDVVRMVAIAGQTGQTVLVPRVFDDGGFVIMRLGFKDPGTPSSPTTPTSANFITITRYRVVYRRGDGRNTPGVDVPYPFDGGLTFSILDIGSGTFILVRSQAKLEPPLIALRGLGGAVEITTVAEVTFYGRDQTGATVQVTGPITVNFADYGDQ